MKVQRLPIVDWKDAVRVFEKVGWRHDRTKGSHYIMIKPDKPGLLSVPMHSPLKRGTLRKLINQAGLSVDEFLCSLRHDP
ncbi:type II toxin-antitoxin system HicA family toxin [Fervidibacter sacchari]|uniref:RNA binding protein YcfA (HicA-like mRNA interferase family) n=1 Tax=Candidatus Fervidibacter sacchari TaxID=1448929 RepID=A0ABT2ENZ8_9BACT|nr:type II toxin-antitoxin system HicA family toxin [Candidatus Fervidibacter sacchari]MCS3918610.1 putative RNA binding protein YcfA (HicA-like mRNA interferase family) [Candidatus Fervidibacter sacchari]WKU17633.1 type II toxin-antitoxin system HicA family toxin [Candidatus Fervidibacter sacchari]